MATFAGNDGVVKIGANALAEVRSFTITETIETIEDTSMGDASRTHKTGLKSWSGNLECHFDDTDTAQGNLTVGASVTLNLQPEGDTTGDFLLTGTATITEVTHTNTIDNIVERTFSFVGNGDLIQSTVA
jgi:hypothetical protein